MVELVIIKAIKLTLILVMSYRIVMMEVFRICNNTLKLKFRIYSDALKLRFGMRADMTWM